MRRCGGKKRVNMLKFVILRGWFPAKRDGNSFGRRKEQKRVYRSDTTTGGAAIGENEQESKRRGNPHSPRSHCDGSLHHHARPRSGGIVVLSRLAPRPLALNSLLLGVVLPQSTQDTLRARDDRRSLRWSVCRTLVAPSHPQSTDFPTRRILDSISLNSAGMFVGIVVRLSPGNVIQNMVSFKSTILLNVLLPPIILNSGYQLKQVSLPLTIPLPYRTTQSRTRIAGKLLQKFRNDLDFCLCRYFHLCCRPGVSRVVPSSSSSVYADCTRV